MNEFFDRREHRRASWPYEPPAPMAHLGLPQAGTVRGWMPKSGVFITPDTPMYFVTRRKLQGIDRHEGVLVGEPNADGKFDPGLPTFDIRSTEGRPRCVTLCELVHDLPFEVHGPLPAGELGEAHARLEKLWWSPPTYHATDYNCQHYAREVLTGKPSSPSVDGWATVAVVALVLAVAK